MATQAPCFLPHPWCAMPHLPTLFLNLLLYPSRVVQNHGVPMRWLLLLSFEVLVVAVGLFMLIGLFLPLDPLALLLGPVVGLVFALMTTGFLIQALPSGTSMAAKVAFCFSRAVSTIGVPLGSGFILSPQIATALGNAAIVQLFLFALGLFVAGNFTVALLSSPHIVPKRQGCAGLRCWRRCCWPDCFGGRRPCARSRRSSWCQRCSALHWACCVRSVTFGKRL